MSQPITLDRGAESSHTTVASIGPAGELMMTEAEARNTVTIITSYLDDARALLLELHEREGWRALGYDSWRTCALAEFGQSQSRLYQLLDAAKVDRALSTQVETTPIPEKVARVLAPVLRHAGPAAVAAVYEYATVLSGGSVPTVEHAEQALGRFSEAGVISIPYQFPDPPSGSLPAIPKPTTRGTPAWPAGACSSCDASVVWARTTKGKPILLDLARVTIIDDRGITHSGHVAHFATCPKAAAHRQGRKGGAR